MLQATLPQKERSNPAPEGPRRPEGVFIWNGTHKTKGECMIGKRWLSVVVLGMFLALASVCWSTPGDVDGFNGVELKDAV